MQNKQKGGMRMSTKNPFLGAVLGFFVLGIFYSGGIKKGSIACILLCTFSYILLNFVSSGVSIIANLIGAGLGYVWAKQHNEQISSAC